MVYWGKERVEEKLDQGSDTQVCSITFQESLTNEDTLLDER